MVIKVGDPEYLGFQPDEGGDTGDIYRVGASRESTSGRLLATGNVIVVVLNDQGYDEATMKNLARQKAVAAITENPDLLTPVVVGPPGTHHVGRADTGSPNWDGDGFLDPPDDGAKTDEPSRILSPDSPQTGQ